MMVAVTPSSKTGDLIGDHAYSVDGIATKKGQTYIELRNPWGFNSEWDIFQSNNPFGDDGHVLLTPDQFKKWIDGIYHDAPQPELPDDAPARGTGRGPRW